MVSRRAAGRTTALYRTRLAQTRPRVHPQIHPAADRVPLGREGDGLAHGVQVAPAFRQTALALERRATAVMVYQIHRLARALGGVGRRQAAAGTLLERRFFSGCDRVPQLGDHRAAVGAPGVQDRVGAPDGVLHLGAVTEQPHRAAAWLLAAGELDQRIDAGLRDAGDDGAVVRPDPALNRQLIGETGPARPLVFERDADLRHGSALRQENVVDRPVEAAGAAQSRNIPAPRDDLRFGAREHPAPEERTAIRVTARLAVIADHLEAAEHPAGLVAATAELPATVDLVTARHRHSSPAARHRSAGDDRVGPLPVDL